MLKSLTNISFSFYLIFFGTIFALFLRVIDIDKVPSSLNWDEISHGYNAYSILKTGKDEWGKSFPVIFRAYGDYKLPVYIYITTVSVFFFGLTPLAVRLPSVLAGVGVCLFTYFLVKELFKNSRFKKWKLEYLSFLLVIFEPWTLFISRASFEANIGLFLFLGGFLFFIKSLKNRKFLLLSSCFFGLSVWAYNSYRVFTPIFLSLLILLFKKKLSFSYSKDKKYILISVLLILFFFIPMFWQLLHPVGQARFGKVSIIDEGAIAKIIEERQRSNLNVFVERILYNRPVYFIKRFIANWFSHFTPRFLFFLGGNNHQFSVPSHGILYLIDMPFFLVGLALLFYNALKKEKTFILILLWLLLGPIASSLTREAPHVLRSVTMLPIPMIITSLGLSALGNFVKKFLPYKMFLIFWMLVFFVFSERFLTKYFTEYKVSYSWAWQYGYKEVVEYVRSRYDFYDKIIVTKKYGEPHEFFLFYWPWDPKNYLADPNLIRFYQSGWYWVDSFDKFYFVNNWEISEKSGENIPRSIKSEDAFKLESGKKVECQFGSTKCLLITSPGNVPGNWRKLKTINFLDGSPAFEIYEN